MLTLEQVRAVNDGLKQGDLSAALKPLEEQIDLRHAELPRLDKAALAALKKGLEVPENARIWAEAAFHPNVSVRRFARKTLLGLRFEAAPVAPFVQARLEQFWAEETPLPWSTNSREAAARREQAERVQSAIDILLRADPDLFMNFWVRLIDEGKPARERARQEQEEWQKRQAAYTQAYRKQTEILIREELGPEFKLNDFFQYSQTLPARLWAEIYEKVLQNAEVKALQEQMGENAWAQAAQQWEPTQLFIGALTPYLQPDATGPQREVAAKVRVHFWKWIEEALDSRVAPEERASVVERVHDNIRSYWALNALGYEQIWEKAPALLQATRSLMDSSQGTTAKRGNYGRRGDASRIWGLLALVLGQSCIRPYNLKDETWAVPEQITPQLLRSFKVEGGANSGANYDLETGAKALSTARQEVAVSGVEKVTVENQSGQTQSEGVAEVVPLNFDTVNWDFITDEADRTGEDWTVVYERSKGQPIAPVEAKPDTLEDIEARVEKLIDPPPAQGAMIPSRISYWRLWLRKVGREALMTELWPKVETRLWEKYEEKLGEYRRAEIDEIAPHLGEKLTANELKEWKANQRKVKRLAVNRQLDDIAFVLHDAQGLEAAAKMLELLERPGLKELREHQVGQLLNELAHNAFIPDQETRQQVGDAEWVRQSWFLEPQWAPLLEKVEAHLLGRKRASPWDRNYNLNLLAVAYYRLNTPQSRAHFRELAAEVESLGHNLVYPVMALGDVDTWLLLISKIEYLDSDLQNLWKQTHQSQSSDAPRLTAKVLETLGTLTTDRSAKFVLEMLKQLSSAELAPHGEAIVSLLECPLVPVKRWALATLPTLPGFEYDAEAVARLVGEMLWSEAALPKDAAKFLGTLASHPQAAAVSWEELAGATSLENITLLETVFRSLAQLRAKNVEFTLDDSARERLEALVEAQPDRFTKFSKKLTLS